MKKTTSVSSWTRPNCFPLKTFNSLPPSLRFFRPFPFRTRLCANFCSDSHNPALKLSSVRELQMHLRGEKLGIVMPLEHKSDTQGMVSHRHKTYLSSRRFLLAVTEKQGECTDCNGSSLPFSQCLLFSESSCIAFLKKMVLHLQFATKTNALAELALFSFQ